MASTSVARDSKAAEVLALTRAGVSQRQIAARLGITRSMVQRVLGSADPGDLNGSNESVVTEFRREVLQELDLIPFATGYVDPMLYELEKAEALFNATYRLTGSEAVNAAKLRRMMAEPRGNH